MIYIDTPCKYEFRGKKIVSSHMISDKSIDELVGFAISIGLKKEWLQHKPDKKDMPHFDVMNSFYKIAVKFGAKEVGQMDLVGKYWMNSTLRKELYPDLVKFGNRWQESSNDLSSQKAPSNGN